MNIAEKTLQLKQDFDEVFEAGKKAEQDTFWDTFQKNDTRQDYQNGFYGWSNFKTIDTKYPVRTNTLYSTFTYCRELEVLPIVLLSNTATGFATCYCAFNDCRKLKSVDFDIVNNNTASSAWDSTFNYCYELKTIQKIVVLESQVFKLSTFRGCGALENLTIEGTIGQNGFNVQWSTLLTYNSLMSIINALKDYSADTSGTEWIVTIGSTNKAKLTDIELDIAQNKGWQVN